MTICSLSIQKLELNIFLGWRDDEQERKQIVFLDVDIQFDIPPKACKTDQLEDSLCYAELIKKIRDYLGEKKFRLIEHVGSDIYHFIKPMMPPHTAIQLRLTKFPQIQGLSNGVCFTYGDK